MKKLSMVEFRRRARRIIARLQKGDRYVLTYRGRSVARLESITAREDPHDDPFFDLPSLARATSSMSNREIDRVIYGI